ncbi:hypothetical protein LZ30DRAFT_122102 [Colletotrichum cereale]|nr:hypothetical protein LZ30DRAFT_122102 [Colletotrichum cereale]
MPLLKSLGIRRRGWDEGSVEGRGKGPGPHERGKMGEKDKSYVGSATLGCSSPGPASRWRDGGQRKIWARRKCLVRLVKAGEVSGERGLGRGFLGGGTGATRLGADRADRPRRATKERKKRRKSFDGPERRPFGRTLGRFCGRRRTF